MFRRLDCPTPYQSPGQHLYELSAAGVNFADTHQIENSYLAAQQLPLVPGRGVRGDAGRRRPAGGRPARRRRLRGEGGRAPAADLAGARRRDRRAGAGRRPAGIDRLDPCCAPAAPLAEGESVVVIAGAAASGRWPSSWRSAGAAGGSSPPRQPAKKRALDEELGADATVDPALADDDPKAFTGALREANGGRPGRRPSGR
jgi:NADPH2:quinone reductase